MNRGGQVGALVAALVVMAAIAAVVMYRSEQLSVIGLGEEGFVPYDAALPGAYSPGLWGVGASTQSLIKASSGALGLSGAASVDSTLCSVSPNGELFCAPAAFETRNLYLEEFRVDYESRAGGRSRTTGCLPGALVEIAGQQYRLSGGGGTDTQGAGCVTRGALSLRWNSYELGEWELYESRAGEARPILSGKAPGGEVRLRFIVEGRQGAWAPATLVLEDARVRALFGCDPQENEEITDACFGGPQVLEREDLPDFKRFCLDLPATFDDDGKAAADKRVYYALASGDPVVIEKGEIWKFQYIASANLGGKTGVSSKCERQVIEDEVDLIDREELVGLDTILWSANRANLHLSSGSVDLLTASTPSYSCQASDGHDAGGDIVSYPLPSASCYTFRVNGVATPAVIDGVWDVRAVSTQARVDYSSEENGVVRSDHWNVIYEARLARKPFEIASVKREGDALVVRVSNDYRESEVALQVVYAPALVSAPLTETRDARLLLGENEVRVPLDDRFEGEVEARAFVFLKTEAGNVQASEQKEVTYSIERESEAESEKTKGTGSSSGIWARILAFLKEVGAWIAAIFTF